MPSWVLQAFVIVRLVAGVSFLQETALSQQRSTKEILAARITELEAELAKYKASGGGSDGGRGGEADSSGGDATPATVTPSRPSAITSLSTPADRKVVATAVPLPAAASADSAVPTPVSSAPVSSSAGHTDAVTADSETAL